MLPGLYYCVQIDYIYDTTTVGFFSAPVTASSTASVSLSSSPASVTLNSTSSTISSFLTSLSAAAPSVTSTSSPSSQCSNLKCDSEVKGQENICSRCLSNTIKSKKIVNVLSSVEFPT